MTKNFIVTAFLLAVFMLPLTAQTRYYRHEVKVGMAVVGLPEKQWDSYKTRIRKKMLWEFDHDPGWGIGEFSKGIMLSYFYHINNDIAVGAMTAFTKDCDKYEEAYTIDNKTRYHNGGDIKAKSIFLMPSLKWSCLKSNWFSLYVKASAGIHYEQMRFEPGDIPLKDNEDYNEDKLWFAYLLTPLGWEAGSQKVRGFVELGFGSNFNLQIGLTYRFGRLEP